MPDADDRNVKHLQEGMSFSGRSKEEIKPKLEIDNEGDDDQEEPMTKERAIHMMGRIFPIELGSRVRNKHQEDGIVEMVGVDFRGVLYLVMYKDHKSYWENEHTIKVISDFGSSEDNSAKKEKDPAIKTDIPEANVF